MTPSNEITAVIIGRFQPFHRGHEEIFNRLAYEEVKRVIVFLGLRRVGDPLSYAERASFFNRYLSGRFDKWWVYPTVDLDGNDKLFVERLEDRILNHTTKEGALIINPVVKGQEDSSTWRSKFHHDGFVLYNIPHMDITSDMICNHPDRLGFLAHRGIRNMFYDGLERIVRDERRIDTHAP